MGIPSGDEAVVLFIAGDVGARRKGFAVLCEALRVVSAVAPVRLLSVGRAPGQITAPVPHVNLGRVEARGDQLRLAYVVAVPSLQEGLSNVVLEARASGVPVVGSEVGGIPDLVTPGVTGFLVEPGDPRSPSAALRALLADSARRLAMGQAARERAVRAFSLERQAARYVRVDEAAIAS